ncbi:Pyruvate carboxylase [Hondaea fermentalgiana]|uniref:Pyruvate carboxylase n=1 Tax=Hondaea fermentalgiana TaxID=2315210 RepID=A0A2R5G3K2_9STRA|nr:Pyruvate carboxylase [Hondaea fermentalgiana]|eukprot:GBG25616.1 Pyruvate carboxylase [Hondaea fermentalgiana]
MTKEAGLRKILVANRGEVALRLVRAASELGIETVALRTEDDREGMHTLLASEVAEIPGKGPAAYLNVDEVVRAAKKTGCQGIIPGYGLLAESPLLSQAAADAGLIFIGPSAETLHLFGDKMASRALAEKQKVPVVPGIALDDGMPALERFFSDHGGRPVMVKARGGGGGKGMRLVRERGQLQDAFDRCKSEAAAFFGNDELFAELFVERAKHVEIQILADSQGGVRALGSRDCSVQRQQQKLIELSPCPSLNANVAAQLESCAVTLASAAKLRGLATFEFLVEGSGSFYFLECNPRLQVEHTVTEEVYGVDLVQTQLCLANGIPVSKALCGPRADAPSAVGVAIELRINTEVMDNNGQARPSLGTVSHLIFPRGKGVRVDSAAHVGYRPHQAFDSLFAKLIVHGKDLAEATRRACGALDGFSVQGLSTNRDFLRAVLEHPTFVTNNAGLDTRFVERHALDLVAAAQKSGSDEKLGSLAANASQEDATRSAAKAAAADAGPGAVLSPINGEVVQLQIKEGDLVAKGTPLALLNAFKMEHQILAHVQGVVKRVLVQAGDVVFEGDVLLDITEPEDDAQREALSRGELDGKSAGIDLDSYTRADLEALWERERYLEDDFRKDKIAQRRHKIGRRSARENLEDIVDAGTYVELGRLAIAHQADRRTVDDLVRTTQGDGFVCGIGSVNGALFSDTRDFRTECSVCSYDYLVLAGTQGTRGHLKKDRIFELTVKWNLPMIILTEGGGGRPSDFADPGSSTAGLNIPAFRLLPNCANIKIGVASGYNFAGNTALLGMCDIIIATKDANIAMGGPVMVEYAGQSKKVAPTELGPAPDQFAHGVVHLMAEDEAEATRMAKQCLSYFQGRTNGWECADQRVLRTLVPENRKRVYDVRTVVEALADKDSVLEWCAGFGPGTVTAFIRVEGWPVGVLANQPSHLSGALDGDSCAKAADFLTLCETHRLPVVNLIDTPGFIVGQEFERTGLVKHCARLFKVTSTMTTPYMSIVLRKSYGLGAMAMAGGALQHQNMFTVAWPTGEFGGMGLEGAVSLTYSKRLSEIEDLKERQAKFDELVQKAHDRGSAQVLANDFAIDDIIDPKDSRYWIRRCVEIAQYSSKRAAAGSSRL